MGKSRKKQATDRPGPKGAARELARLEKRLVKARGLETKRNQQAADASAEVAALTARIASLREPAGEGVVTDAPVAEKPAPQRAATGSPARRTQPASGAGKPTRATAARRARSAGTAPTRRPAAKAPRARRAGPAEDGGGADGTS